jgi:hypothetical protein
VNSQEADGIGDASQPLVTSVQSRKTISEIAVYPSGE